MPAMVRRFSRNIRKLAAHSGGNVSILLAIAAVPLFMGAGAAIDYIRAMRAQTELQAASDSAALAAARLDTDDPEERKAAGITYFQSNFQIAGFGSIVPEVSVDADKVVVTATLNYPTSFMGLAGIAAMEIGSLAEVELAKSDNIEVVLVLDYSGSMLKDDKYIRMRDAATKMVEQLSENAEKSVVKFGLVPFSAMVRTSMSAAYVTQPEAGAIWTGCTQDRKYPYNIGVSTPTAADDTKWGFIDDSGSENAAPQYDCAKYQSNKLDILPLTADIASVNAQLAAMAPVGNTNIPLGTEFGWNLLDPAEPFAEGAAYTDETTKKFLVLLTDGVQTSRHWGPSGDRSVANGNDNLVETCDGMSGKGITTFAIAFDIKAAAVTELLKACAPGNYFESDSSGAAIDAVFKAITERIEQSMLRLTR